MGDLELKEHLLLLSCLSQEELLTLVLPGLRGFPVVLHDLQGVLVLDDKVTGMATVRVVNPDPDVRHLSSNEEVLVDRDVTVGFFGPNTNFLIYGLEYVLLGICHDGPDWGHKDTLPGSDLALAIFIVEKVHCDRHNLNFQEILDLCSVVAPGLSSLHALCYDGWNLDSERISRLAERHSSVVKFVHNLAQ